MESNSSLLKSTILVVDDTPENLWFMSSLLKSRYHVKIATNGLKAIEIARAHPQPDLILLDIVMPEMDGYEVCLTLKGAAETNDIPIIFLTGRATAEDEAHGRMIGAIDYITKPIDSDRVLASIDAHLTAIAMANACEKKHSQ
ncbi:response regulator [Pseudomonas sp. OV226]|uniref:response regulator n=1 Tax=Pseudomonas sp. OV226 TaxID=2135588 RepID=UPI000D7A3A60|nr:response regulator [Pseudomonas sp. OV226]PWK30223.1 putative two-component system response regulator [Pseudomonas sp. OV226]